MKIGMALVLDRLFQILVIFILNYLVLCRVVDLVQTHSYVGYITFLKSEQFLLRQ